MSKLGKIVSVSAMAAAIVLVVGILSTQDGSKVSAAKAATPVPVEATPQPTSEAWLLAQNGLGAPAPLDTYTASQLKVIGALYDGKMDGVKGFEDHCGKADVAYTRSSGRWHGATTLMYSTGQNRELRDDISVIIAKRSALPREMGDLYVVGARDKSAYAMKVYLATTGIEKVALDPGRAAVLVGCRP